jgi:hypothetical protein
VLDRWLLTKADAARYLLVDRRTFEVMVDSGIVPYVIDFDGIVKYSRLDLEEARLQIDLPWGRLRGLLNS